MEIGCSSASWGEVEGNPVSLYTLGNEAGATVKLTNYGARITELQVKDRRGEFANVVLGFDKLSDYLQPNPYFGATIGRVANRIARARFVLDGEEYVLPANDAPHCLHGGATGFDRRVWTAECGEDKVTFELSSPAGDQGFPGNLSVSVTYQLIGADELHVSFSARADRPTPVCLTNHAYFNLSGYYSAPQRGSGETCLDHLLWVAAEQYTPCSPDLIPRGVLAPVESTPFDFRCPVSIRRQLAGLPEGFDNNFVLSAGRHPAAVLFEPVSGRKLELLTSSPGLQFYSGNFLDGSISGVGGAFVKHAACCLEPQYFPNSVNEPSFPSVILRPGHEYRESITYRFRVE